MGKSEIVETLLLSSGLQASYRRAQDIVASNPRSVVQAMRATEHSTTTTLSDKLNVKACTRKIIGGGFGVGDQRSPKRIMPGKLENTGRREPEGKELEWRTTR
ncbi:unnamed protein product [Ascophyllum nodosum]